jgi:hypothetical protein
VITAGTNGGTLTLAMVDQDRRRRRRQQPEGLVMNKAMRRKITALVVAAAGGAAVLDVGKQLTEYNGVPIEVLDEDGDERRSSASRDAGLQQRHHVLYCIRPAATPTASTSRGWSAPT